ncbi:TPA: hypothetical protein ACQRM5_000392 [Pseudomonas aeruginosa]|uniref:hypothetical protein n=1 Tax=Pseudomonas aeruginosa TaxID=287 RepID=UPI000F89CCD4|nr:hypothetical protein [Pseudomonas aeruginosa]ELH7017583.1 hypothetical protein [Pseudomonas aeruginosa]ELN2057446.1 hypothetical protein [Pseudomonas aeruginosa]QGF97902.1 hypothetical protein GFD20_03370 [Pseudomonas aeruginosa]RTT20015.1 hypothetical protein DY953_25695 [Pseudomonas aeruginosa]RUF21713.1 hypothetical protein IPC1111_18410 [Pseudomonas aeruginosa]
MKYSTGETVELGGLVLIESGKTLGVVYAIIETPEDALNWGLDEAGISISERKGDRFIFTTLISATAPTLNYSKQITR